MKVLEFLKSNLRETLLKGIEETISSLKNLLPKNSDKYQSLILLESRLNEINRKSIRGTISEENSQLEKNKIRESLMILINNIQQNDVDEPTKTSTDNPPSKADSTKFHKNKKWSAEITQRDKLDVIAFNVQLNNPHKVKYYVKGAASILEVDDKIVSEEKVTIQNAIQGVANYLFKNEETTTFNILDGNDLLLAKLTMSYSLSPPMFKKVRLTVDKEILISDGFD